MSIRKTQLRLLAPQDIIVFDNALAMQNMFLAAQALGLGTRMYMRPLENLNENLLHRLGAPENYRAIMILRIGQITAYVVFGPGCVGLSGIYRVVGPTSLSNFGRPNARPVPGNSNQVYASSLDETEVFILEKVAEYNPNFRVDLNKPAHNNHAWNVTGCYRWVLDVASFDAGECCGGIRQL